MKRIYLDNAATSFPKAPGTGERIAEYLNNEVLNTNRTESGLKMDAFDASFTLRKLIADLYGYNHPEAIGFTRNVTEAMNWIIKGLFHKGDHIILSSNEHNGVMRPIIQEGIEFSRIPSYCRGYNDYSSLPSLLRPNTKAIIINAAGNVSGAVQNLEIPSEFARKKGLMLFVDSAQASPFVPIDMSSLSLSGIAFTGHKGFLGPQGIGGMLLKEDIALRIRPLIAGGTGSRSDSEEIPAFLPDRLNPGTENMVGIIGLLHSLSFVLSNLEELRKHEMERTLELMEGLEKIRGITLKGAGKEERRTNVVSIQTEGMDEAMLSALLSERGGIETRVGLHCSPSSHRVLGTFPRGTLRLSPGPFTTKDEIEFTLSLIKEITDNA